MKRLATALSLLLVLAAPALGAAPKLVTDALVFDFGKVFQGERVDHTFRFHNAGDAPLNIVKVRSSCGCTAALLSAKVIPPGESGEIKASFDSTRFRGDVAKTIYLYADDPQQPEVHFTLRGTVQEELAVNPQQVIIRELPPGESRTVKLTLMNRGNRELTIAPPETSAPGIEAKVLQETLAPGQATDLEITAKPAPTAQRLAGYVFVRTVEGKTAEVRIPVQALLKK